ncbi:MAG TPA: trehalase family glycosidase [Bacteroidota bacterium]|nr:trehalase family glycosidase [Bacteroidota bacterium]
MRIRASISALFLVPLWFSHGQPLMPYLSSLSATKDSPLFTTYAAAEARSEFTLDKGYHLLLNDPDRGADLTNASGGDICLAFKSRGKYVYATKDMFRQPVVTASYSDLVTYTFWPFDSISVNVTFVVYSSHYAVQAIDVKNTGRHTVNVEVIPFLQNRNRTYDSVEFRKDAGAISFTHEEFPDDWVIEHGVPFVSSVRDAYTVSDPPDRMMSFRSYQWGPVAIPGVIDPQKKPVYLIWGRMGNNDGGRCTEDPASSRLMALLNGDPRRIITESAPRWGSTESNVTGYGYYGLELGNFGALKSGDRFTLLAGCGDSGATMTATGTLRAAYDGDSARVDLRPGGFRGPLPPADLRMNIWGSGAEVRLFWKPSAGAASYNVYRRDERSGGVYDLIAGGVRQSFYTDKNIGPDKVYRYVVVAVDSGGALSMHSREVNNIAGSDFLTDIRYPGQGVSSVRDLARIVAFSCAYDLRPGYTHRLIAVRAVGRPADDVGKMIDTAKGMVTLDLPRCIEADEALYRSIPPLASPDTDIQMLYWSAFSLMRQVMLPPEAKCHYNYYVFSREPQWGWGHGGQVFHESLTMLSYALMDPPGAMNSQRVYMERQKPDGYINYRTGPYLDEEIPYNGQLTTSAPWYAWQNWEIYRATHDRKFLEDAYASSAAFYRYYTKNRDADGDGLCEWGAHAVLESVRDGMVAVWDKVGWPSNFESVDLNAMLVSEAKSLTAMAMTLGKKSEAGGWEKEVQERSARINALMWDSTTGFYYNVDRKTHTFTSKTPGDLKRQEIIGFLPLWAGIATKEQAARLVEKLKDTSKFWRQYGVPSLAADDPYYNPKGYWNGPMWVQWNYLIVRGLLQYGYAEEARELTGRVARAMIAQLKKDHNFWEFYSPDEAWAGYHRTYIWAGIINRMLIEVAQAPGK